MSFLTFGRYLLVVIGLFAASTAFSLCAQESASDTEQTNDSPQQVSGIGSRPSILSTRIENDRTTIKNTFAITQFNRNYILPVTYVTNPNALGNAALTPENVDNVEAKYQLSIKLPLYLEDASVDGVYLGFTVRSFWQLYNSEVSKPFRETNYEPEIFYQWDADISLLGLDFNILQIGFNHMSNGQSGLRSRSWNRITLNTVFSDYEDLYFIKTWYRLPEDEKVDENDPSGDDNPDILDYYGRIELGYGTRIAGFTLMASVRNNLSFSNNRGSLELSLSYPISNRYEALITYFNGYGDSLIDYNRSQERIGVGIQLAFF